MGLLSVVGSDPAPVAWGAKVFLKHFPPRESAPTIYLLPSSASDRFPQEKLVRWLSERGFSIERVDWEKLGNLKGPLVLNLTAGTKEELFRLLQAFKGPEVQGFVLEAHTPPPVLAWLDGTMTPLSEPDHLTPGDYASLYGVPILGNAETSSVPAGLQGPTWYRIKTNSERMLFAVHQGRPCVYAEAPATLEFKDYLNILARKTKSLGGQLVRVFSQVPQGRPQNENDRATLLQQAKEAGVELVFPGEPRGHHFPLTNRKPIHFGLIKGQSPFSPPDRGPVLLGLISEQPVPILASFLAHAPRRVYLASTQDLERRLGRLEAARRVFAELGAQVEVATVSGPQAMKEVEALFRPVVAEAVARGLPVVANLNGGTKLMALGLLRALAPSVAVEYLQGKDPRPLSPGSHKPVPWVKASPEQVLRLFGYHLKPTPEWEKAHLNDRILTRAETLLRNPGNPSLAQDFLKAWQKTFGGLVPSHLEKDGVGKALGLALEYVVFYYLQDFLKQEGRVAPPGHLVPTQHVHNPREVDGVFWLGGILGFVECKQKLRDALNRHHEDTALWLLQERFGGLFGKGILVVRKAGWRPHEKLPARLQEVLADPNLRIFCYGLKEGTV